MFIGVLKENFLLGSLIPSWRMMDCLEILRYTTLAARLSKFLIKRVCLLVFVAAET
jgi:hypothetical protein